MTNVCYAIYLFMMIGFQCSCIVPNKPEKVAKPTLVSFVTSDTLTFKSGIRSILHDSKGNYWLGSHAEGLAFFDGQSYTYFSKDNGLPDHQIRSIQEDESGTIWVGTSNGVCSYDGKTFTQHQIPPQLATPLYTDWVTNWSKTPRDLWFNAGNQPGIYKHDGQKLSYLPFPTFENSAYRDYLVTDIAKGANDMIWIGTYDGVIGYDGRDFTIINNDTLGFSPNSGLLHVRSLLEDSKGRLWIGNNSIGVLLKENDTIVNFSEANQLVHPLSKKNGNSSPAGTLEHVFAIEEDADGNIWFGDRDTGAWKYDGQTITNYPIDTTLSSAMVWTIYTDRDNNLLLGLMHGGVYQFNGTNFEPRF